MYLNRVRVVRAATLGGVLALGLASNVRAGPLEELEQVALGPTGSQRMALRYVFGGEGLVLSGDGGESWRALCADGITPAGWANPPVRLGRVAIDGDGVLYLATFTGLIHDDGAGCNWQSEEAFADDWVTDVVVHPTDPDVLFAITSNAGGAQNGVHRRDADGTWREVGTRDELLIGRLLVVDRGSGELRMVQGAIRGMTGTPPDTRPNYVVRVSDDLGVTWDEFAFGETAGVIEVEAVDPTNPDRIVASLRFDAHEQAKTVPDRVLVSGDRGETFTEYLEVTQFGGVDFAPDGRVWIADRGDSFDGEAPSGLFHAASLDEAATKVFDTLPLSCVDYRADLDEVFVCQPYEAGFVDADGQGYRKVFAFREAEALVACSGVTVASACSQAFNGAWCGASHFPSAPLCCVYPSRQGVDAGVCESPSDAGATFADASESDGSSSDGDVPAGEGSSANSSDGGCSCRLGKPSHRSDAGPGPLLALLALGLVARRRGARTRPAPGGP